MTNDSIVQLLENAIIPDANKRFKKWKLLELGSGRGLLIEELRDLGVDAYGIDIAPRRRYKYLKKGDIRYLNQVFGRQKFQIIVANGVLCLGGLVQGLSNTQGASLSDDNIGQLAKQTALEILQSSYNQLIKPGVFINTEDNYQDSLIYSRKNVKDIGFVPYFMNKRVSILEKQK